MKGFNLEERTACLAEDIIGLAKSIKIDPIIINFF